MIAFARPFVFSLARHANSTEDERPVNRLRRAMGLSVNEGDKECSIRLDGRYGP